MASRKPRKPDGKAKRPRTTAKRVQATEADPDGPTPRTLPQVHVNPEGDDEGFDGNPDGLKPRQRAFVEAYCGRAGGNATEAARLVGYNDCNNSSLRSMGSRLLTIGNVQRAIARRFAEKFGGPEDVVRSVAEVARGNAGDYLDWGPDGRLQISLEKLAASGQMGLVREIKEKGIDAGGGQVIVIERHLKLYDKLKALELLARLNGQLVERQRVEGEIEVKSVYHDPKTGDGVTMDDLDNPNAPGANEETFGGATDADPPNSSEDGRE